MHTQEKFQNAVDKIAQAEGQPVEFYNLLLSSASNNISALLCGRRFQWDHPNRAHVDKLINKLLSALRFGGLFQFNPTFFTTILKNIPGSRLNNVMARIGDIARFTK
ncbi:hypothetical protein HPB48_005772 [Haemaphysalis longicornis]|uniref:Uncharacterized protein n=1 Tax=Haemaphysalis longicornis TaxID=44386 RepID=A0A9J6F6Q0_HAELO|nr:hypothetical protein HPB48_005772 [Haemaphysalis longicornis]